MSRLINFRADEELDKRLERLAKLTGRSKTFYIREAVSTHIDNLEDIYLADQVMDRLENGTESLHALEEVEKELGLAD
ncbi:MAG: CopG family transcriptional regulator [Gammaproteobacteria bacterium RIFCSPLOWO2_12_47_11]|nr:MAG: CopG family transcriptional regulator [Gammaproteobacteria bacterium RIFCSPLOWO2_12_47_11]